MSSETLVNGKLTEQVLKNRPHICESLQNAIQKMINVYLLIWKMFSNRDIKLSETYLNHE